MAGRKPLNKVRMNIKIDSELKEILDSKKIDKSAYINQILYKELVLEKHGNPNPSSHLPPLEMFRRRFELRTTRLSVEHSNRTELTEHYRKLSGNLILTYSPSASCRTRTCDPTVNSRVLYLLS